MPVARHLYPFSLNSNISYIASAIGTQPGSTKQSFIGQLQEISNMADFYSKYVNTCIRGDTAHSDTLPFCCAADPQY